MTIFAGSHPQRAVAARAFRGCGASCLLAAPTPLEMCAECGSTISATRPTVNDAYPYPYGPYPTRAEDFYPDYIEKGDSHNPTSRSAKARDLLHHYIVGLMVIVRVGYGPCTGIPAGQVRQSVTERTLTPVACGAIRYANWGLSGRTGEMLIKT